MLKQLIFLALPSLVLVPSIANAQETQQFDAVYGVGTLFAPAPNSQNSLSPQGAGGERTWI